MHYIPNWLWIALVLVLFALQIIGFGMQFWK